MPIKDLEGPPLPDPRTQASMMRLIVRLHPELDWWPRWSARNFGAMPAHPKNPEPRRAKPG